VTTVLVVSDTHGDLSFVRRILAAHPEVETLIHLGDNCDDALLLASEASLPLHNVRGNGDFDCTHGCPASAIVEIAGHRLLLVHGHLQDVKRGLSRLTAHSAQRLPPVEIVLFGHTHRPCQLAAVREDGSSFLLLNPGSAREPRRGFGETAASCLLLRIGEVEGPGGVETVWE
jgi:putative phosphoesterase